ncbi:hypothetical protein [Patiriisocius marinistellae]|nr:hypothetical protein [Patiriisocius marinistellae]
MKGFKLTFSILFFVTVAFTACKDDDNNDAVEDPRAQNLKALGTSAEDILSNATFKSLTVELAYTNNQKPSQEALDRFKDFIIARVNKSDGVNFIETVVPNQSGAPFTIQEIRDIETNIRTQYTVGDDIAMYVFFSNGSSENDTDTTVTLGTAYQNTSVVVYQNTLVNITADDPEVLPLLESTTLHHEFGHILGLVNIQDDDIHIDGEHEDLDHPKHCVIEDCLMFFEASNITRSHVTRMVNMLRQRANVPEFDIELCLADLQAKGSR